MLTDTHAHIDFSQFDNDRDDVIKRASAENIIIINSGLGVSGIIKAVDLTRKYNNIYATLGLHPASCNPNFHRKKRINKSVYNTSKFHTSWIKERSSSNIIHEDINNTSRLDPGEIFINLIDETIGEIRKNKDNKKVIGIGEVGLDYHWVEEKELRKIQQKSFEKFIQLSNEINLPLLVHSRNAEKDCIKILKQHNKRAILHCFSGTTELALEAISFGCLISITTTFMNSPYRKRMVSELPLEKIVLETDAPYLSPFPSKRNEPINIKLTAKKIAEIKGTKFEKVAEITTKNVEKFFAVKF